jgi:predicted RND superfamily exporter protein
MIENKKPHSNIIVLLFSLTIVLLGTYFLPNIPIQNDVKQLFKQKYSQNDTRSTIDYSFSKNNDFVLLHIKSEIKDFEILKKIKSLNDSLSKFDFVDSTIAITTIKIPKKVGAGIYFKPLINLNKDRFTQEDFDFVNSFKDITPFFINNSWNKFNILISLKPDFQFKTENKITLENIAHFYGFSDANVIGSSVFDNEIKSRVEHDIFRLAIIGFIIIVLVFWIFFRSFYVVLFIGFMVVVNVNAAIIFIKLLNVEFNIMTAVIPTLIAILSVTDLTHILHVYKENEHLQNFSNRIKISFKSIKYALIMTSLTTAIGFSIFLINDVKSIVDFGLIAILSISFALFSAWYIAPILLTFIPLKSIKLLNMKLIQQKVISLLIQKKKLLFSIFILFFASTSVVTFSLWRIDYIIYDDLELNSKLYKTYQSFNAEFQGTRSIEIVIKDSTKDILKNENIIFFDSIENEILHKFNFNYLNSYNSLLKNYNRTIHKGNNEYYKIPKDSSIITIGKIRIQDNIDSNIILKLVDFKNNAYKIQLFGPEIFSSEGVQQISTLEKYLELSFQNTTFQFEITGDGMSRDESTNNISTTIIFGIFISIGIISLIMGFTFKSIKISIVAWLVNLLPVFFSVSILFLSGFHITPAIAMMLSISFGIALDDTIYFLGRLKSQQIGVSDADILENVKQISFPVISTSIILSLSFCALFFSSFSFNTMNALIIVCTLIIAMICDLVFLPLLLLIFQKNNKTSIK